MDQNENINETDIQILNEIDTILYRYSEYLNQKGLSEKTKKDYLLIAKKFLYQIKGNILSINEDELLFYFQNRKNFLFIGAMKNLFEFLGIENDFKNFYKKYKNFLKKKKQPKRIVLSFIQIKTIIDNLPMPFKLIAMIQWDTAMRIKAVLNLHVNNIFIDDDKKIYIFSIEKGNKQRTRYLTNETGIILNDYIIQKNINNLIFNPNKEKYNTIYRKYETWLRYISIKFLGYPISSHCIRRSRAVYLIHKGYNIETIKNFLGHRHIGTTDIYIESAGESSKKIIETESFWNI